MHGLSRPRRHISVVESGVDMKTAVISAVLAAAILAGCVPSNSVSDLKVGMAKKHIVGKWGKPAVVPRTMAIKDGSVMEIYQYESGYPREITTLYFRDNKLWYWDSKDWRGTSESEYIPGKQ